MPGTINNEYGKVTISEDIIATVAGMPRLKITAW